MSIAARFLVLVSRPRFCINAILLSGVLLGLGACGGSDGIQEVVARPTDVDTSYFARGLGGQAVVPFAAGPGGVGPSVMQTDGKLAIAGWRQTASLPAGAMGGHPAQEVYVFRLNGDGSRDASFGSGGEVRFNVKGSDAPVLVRMQPDGNILLAVNTWEPCAGVFIGRCFTSDGLNAAGDIALVRLTKAGLLDVSFGGTGIVLVGAGGGALDLALQTDGRVLLLLSPRPPSFVLPQILGWSMSRYTDKGTLDTTFNNSGSVSSTCQAAGGSMVIQSDEKIVVAGSRYHDSDPTLGHGFCLERINADGSHDLHYRKAGLWTTFDNNVALASLWLLPGDEVLAVGKSCNLSTCGLIAARFDNGGQLNPSFGASGIAKVAMDNDFYLVNSAVMEAGGLVTLGTHTLAATEGKPQTYQPFWIAFDAIGQAPVAFGENGILRGAAESKSPINFLRDKEGRWILINQLTYPEGYLEIVVNRLIGESLGSI